MNVLPARLILSAVLTAACAILPSCKVLTLPFRVAGAVVNTGTDAVDKGMQKHKLKQEQKAREEKAAKEAAAKQQQPSPPGAVPPLPGESPGVLPPPANQPPAGATAPPKGEGF